MMSKIVQDDTPLRRIRYDWQMCPAPKIDDARRLGSPMTVDHFGRRAVEHRFTDRRGRWQTYRLVDGTTGKYWIRWQRVDV